MSLIVEVVIGLGGSGATLDDVVAELEAVQEWQTIIFEFVRGLYLLACISAGWVLYRGWHQGKLRLRVS